MHASVHHLRVLAERCRVMVTHAHVSDASQHHHVSSLPQSLHVMATGPKKGKRLSEGIAHATVAVNMGVSTH